MKYVLFVLMLLMTMSCGSNKKLIGLWQIDKVKVGSEEMTPIARWTRFNEDQSQASGNGWMQHSVGTWEYHRNKNELSVVNTNGIKDEFGPFMMRHLDDDQMSWVREEEGQQVEVVLKRITNIPTAPANKLLGVWKLVSKKGEDESAYLFLRWDRIIINREAGKDRKYGMYKTHGHRQQLQIIYYGDPLSEENWDYRLDSDDELMLENKGQGTVLRYKRIDFVPK